MAKKTVSKNSNGAGAAAGKKGKKAIENHSAETPAQGVSTTEQGNENVVVAENTEVIPPEEANTDKNETQKRQSGKAKPGKANSAVVKQPKIIAAVTDKKTKLVATGYHYYRRVLRDWLREHKVLSARFMKNPDSYNGYVVVLESEKAQAIKALAQYRKENPDVKDLWKELKK